MQSSTAAEAQVEAAVAKVEISLPIDTGDKGGVLNCGTRSTQKLQLRSSVGRSMVVVDVLPLCTWQAEKTVEHGSRRVVSKNRFRDIRKFRALSFCPNIITMNELDPPLSWMVDGVVGTSFLVIVSALWA